MAKKSQPSEFVIILSSPRVTYSEALGRPVSQDKGEEITVGNDEAWRLIDGRLGKLKTGPKPTKPEAMKSGKQLAGSIASPRIDMSRGRGGSQEGGGNVDDERIGPFDAIGLHSRFDSILEANFADMEALEAAVNDADVDLSEIDGIGPKTAEHIEAFFAPPSDET